MGSISTALAAAFRDFSVDGVSASGAHEPVKSEIRGIGAVIEAALSTITLGTLLDVAYATRAALNGDLAHAAGSVGLVYADETDENNDLYIKTGASGAGGWTLTTTLHDAIGGRVRTLIGEIVVDAVAGNVGVGNLVYSDLTSGTDNTAFGDQALRDVTTGTRNIGIGKAALRLLEAGTSNVAVGGGALVQAQAVSNCVAIGDNALFSLVAGNNAVAIGSGAALGCLDSEITAIGAGALANATDGDNVAVGVSAGASIVSGTRNTFLGYSAGTFDDFSDVIAIGRSAVASASGQIAFGTGLQTHLQMFGIDFAHWDADAYNLWIGAAGPTVDPTGQRNLGIGKVACNSVTSGANNLGIGEGALELQATGNNNVAIGVTTAQFATSIADCSIVGHGAARRGTTGVGATVVGFRALQHAGNLANNTALGDSALWHTQGQGNVAIGYVVAEGMSQGDRNVIIGRGAGRYRDNGDDNVFVGERAGAVLSNAAPGQPGENIGVGDANPEDNIGGAAAGHRNVGVGRDALGNARGNELTAIGFNSGLSIAGTANANLGSTFIGANAGNNVAQKVDAVNSTALGSGSFTEKDNQVVIGNSAVVETVVRGVTRHNFFTVATLPAASVMGAGARAFVSNALANTFNSVVVGGGSNAVPVFSDGFDWRIG